MQTYPYRPNGTQEKRPGQVGNLDNQGTAQDAQKRTALESDHGGTHEGKYPMSSTSNVYTSRNASAVAKHKATSYTATVQLPTGQLTEAKNAEGHVILSEDGKTPKMVPLMANLDIEVRAITRPSDGLTYVSIGGSEQVGTSSFTLLRNDGTAQVVTPLAMDSPDQTSAYWKEAQEYFYSLGKPVKEDATLPTIFTHENVIGLMLGGVIPFMALDTGDIFGIVKLIPNEAKTAVIAMSTGKGKPKQVANVAPRKKDDDSATDDAGK